MPKPLRASIIRAEANEPVKPATMSFVRKMESENNVPKLARVKSGLAAEKVGGHVRKAFTDLRNIPVKTKQTVKNEKPSFDDDAAATKLTKYPSIEHFPMIKEESDDELPSLIDEDERHSISQMKNIFMPALKPPFDYGKIEEPVINIEYYEGEPDRENFWHYVDKTPLMIDDSKIPLPTLP